MWPYDESVHIMEPTEGLMGSPVECHLLEIFHEEVGDAQR
jgi:hypothetical protein